MYLSSPVHPLCSRHSIPIKGRVSGAPFASGDTFRAVADHIYDDTETTRGSVWAPEHVKAGDVIFVKTDYLTEFFTSRHKAISCPYIIITHNSDYSTPADPTNGNFTSYLDSPILGHWYGLNMVTQHPKLSGIPIGIANYYWAHGKHDQLTGIARKALASDWASRPIKIYMNVSPQTNPKRQAIVAAISKLSNHSDWVVKVVGPRANWSVYLDDVVNSQYVVSPPGNGVDTHRAWEAIYLGAIPILLSGPLDYLFEGMPVLIVQDYTTDVTPQLLQSFQEALKDKYLTTNKGWAMYWRDQIHDMKLKVQEASTNSSSAACAPVGMRHL